MTAVGSVTLIRSATTVVTVEFDPRLSPAPPACEVEVDTKVVLSLPGVADQLLPTGTTIVVLVASALSSTYKANVLSSIPDSLSTNEPAKVGSRL
jgi:hypothetical protein